MNKDDGIEKKVVELLDQSLKGINKRTAARLQYIRNNALENFESRNVTTHPSKKSKKTLDRFLDG